MAGEQVEYEITLKDLLSDKIQKAEQHVGRFEGAMHQLQSTAVRTMEAFGIGFAMFQGFDFVKDSVKEVQSINEATAQVRAGLESTRGAAGLMFEDLEKGADEAADRFEYTKGQIMGMQSILVTFPGVTRETFGTAQQAIIDMSTRMHQDLQSTAIQVGKALQDPVHGISALHRVGVNFNATQVATIKQLVATGQAAKAQSVILHELGTEFAGSAKAAADADPLFKFHKLMEQTKESVGRTAIALLHNLTPALESIVGTVKSAISWMKEHKDLMLAIAGTAGVVAAGYGIYTTVTNAAAIGTKLLTAAQWLLNAAFWASPIGIVTGAIAVLTGAAIYCWNHFGEGRGIILGIWEVLKGLGNYVYTVFIKYWQGLGEMIHGALTLNWSEIKQGFSDATAVFHTGGLNIAENFKKGYQEGMADFSKDHEKKPGLVEKPAVKKGMAAIPSPATQVKGPKASTSGTKNIKIDIKIGQLVGKFEVNSTTIKESVGKIRDHITEALVSAVNDSQLVAGL